MRGCSAATCRPRPARGTRRRHRRDARVSLPRCRSRCGRESLPAGASSPTTGSTSARTTRRSSTGRPAATWAREFAMNLLHYFEALEASPIGVFVKDKAATFAVIEAVHLMALALLGAAVLSADLRLLNLVMRDVPSNQVTDQAHRWFKLALGVLLVAGV